MLKTLGRETKGFRLISVLTPIFMIAEVIMEMIIPKMMASIIDNGVTPGNMQVIYTVGAQMVVAALFGLLFGILGAVAGSHAATALPATCAAACSATSRPSALPTLTSTPPRAWSPA